MRHATLNKTSAFWKALTRLPQSYVEGGVTHFTSCATFPQSALRKGGATGKMRHATLNKSLPAESNLPAGPVARGPASGCTRVLTPSVKLRQLSGSTRGCLLTQRACVSVQAQAILEAFSA